MFTSIQIQSPLPSNPDQPTRLAQLHRRQTRRIYGVVNLYGIVDLHKDGNPYGIIDLHKRWLIFMGKEINEQTRLLLGKYLFVLSILASRAILILLSCS
jgi:hypothetical protein